MVRGRITKVHHKGFAFAKTSQGVVFIPAKTHEALGNPVRGSIVELTVTPGPKGLIAQIPTTSSIQWNTWQVGAGAIELPNTTPSSKHTISFGCFRCGSEIVAGEDVYKIKNAAIWTHGLPTALKQGKKFFNHKKNVHGYSALCIKCNFNLGTIYPGRYEDAEPEKTFPCAKLTYARERRCDDTLLHCLVVLAESKKAAEISVSRLVLADDKATASNVRVTSHTWELMQKLNKANESTRSAEIRADEAVTRELQVLSVLDKQEHDKAHAYKKAKKAQELARTAAAECQAERDRANERLHEVQVECSNVHKKLHELRTARESEQHKTIFVATQRDSLAAQVRELEQHQQRLSAERDSLRATVRQKGDEVHEKDLQLEHHERVLRKLVQASPSASKSWATPGVRLPDGATKHEIRREDLRSGEDTREQDEFNFACGQMLRFLGLGNSNSNSNIGVQRVVVFESPLVSALYKSKKEAMLREGECRELWVFHGTAEGSIESIMATGFKVGGGGTDSVPIRNGAAYGRGVYTATGPATPISYSQHSNGKCVILSKALEGIRGGRECSDCWAPRGDWLIFKSGEQLLPRYAVYW